ncbi:MAG: hypothetical protein ABIK62_01020 [candidate division WOR-3 bacterium]
MLTRQDIEAALEIAGVRVYDETPGAVGGFAFEIAGLSSGHYGGRLEAIVAGLKCAEELAKLCHHFRKDREKKEKGKERSGE